MTDNEIMRGLFGAIALLSFVFFSFQNCSKGFDAGSEEPTSQCVSKLANKVLAEGNWSAEVCAAIENYRCKVDLYSPEIENGSYTSRECFMYGEAEICFDLEGQSFNTSSRLGEAETNPEFFEEGGDYNRSYYTCYHTGIEKHGYLLVKANGHSLEEAYTFAADKCLQGVQEYE